MLDRMLQRRLEAARDRLAEAQAIAAQLRHDADLHRLAMRAVFVLEDCVFSFEEAHRLTHAPVPEDQH